jgi:hypothetical protein
MSSQPPRGGTTNTLNLTYYPATLVLYTAGIGMLLDNRIAVLEKILRQTTPIHTFEKPGPYCSELAASRSLSYLGSKREASQHVYDVIAPIFRDLLVESDQRVRAAFDQLELLMALLSFYSTSNSELEIRFASTGIIRRQGGIFFGGALPVSDLEKLRKEGAHPWIALGLFDGDQVRFEEALARFNSEFTTSAMYPSNY